MNWIKKEHLQSSLENQACSGDCDTCQRICAIRETEYAGDEDVFDSIEGKAYDIWDME